MLPEDTIEKKMHKQRGRPRKTPEPIAVATPEDLQIPEQPSNFNKKRNQVRDMVNKLPDNEMGYLKLCNLERLLKQ